jgi:Protein of unknown function (DUF5818)
MWRKKMKRFLSMVTILGLMAFGLSLTSLAQNQPGQSPAQSPTTQSPSQTPGQSPSAQQPVDTQSARSFEGKITKSGDKLVLQDSATGQSYQLDDQDKAKQFEGKNVKVTGTMDPATNSLHVADIAAAEK